MTEERRRVHLEPSVSELRLIVAGLALHPHAADLYTRYVAKLHLETLLPVPSDCRRVLVRIASGDGSESCVEYYDTRTCDRLEAAIERAQRRRARRRPVTKAKRR